MMHVSHASLLHILLVFMFFKIVWHQLMLPMPIMVAGHLRTLLYNGHFNTYTSGKIGRFILTCSLQYSPWNLDLTNQGRQFPHKNITWHCFVVYECTGHLEWLISPDRDC